MFTGLVDGIGTVIDIDFNNNSARLMVRLPYAVIEAGESIAINGVCLTAVKTDNYQADFDVSSETLAVTNIAQLTSGDKVNCERAMLANTRVGGHMVTGHVDNKLTVISLESCADYVKIFVGNFSNQERLYLINKGCIAIDGVSLTINKVLDTTIELMLVPHTIQNTHFFDLKQGDTVNVEFDYMTRIIANQVKLILADPGFM